MITLKGIFLSGAYGAIDLATKYIDQQQGMQKTPVNATNIQRLAVSVGSLLLNMAGYFDDETTILFYSSLPALEDTVANLAGASFAKFGTVYKQTLPEEVKQKYVQGVKVGPVY